MRLEDDVWRIDAEGLHYKELNRLLKELNHRGAAKIELYNVYGQRYIGTNLRTKMNLEIHGVPGNDLGAFMDGPEIVVHGNVQDCCGNTMNDGRIIVHGQAGDITGYSMRGGSIFIRDDVGYRAGIHMKEYGGKRPCLVIGGTAQDFLGEYMAGGTVVILGLNLKPGERHKARFVGTGMHGGAIYIHGEVASINEEAEIVDLDEEDWKTLRRLVYEFCEFFKFDAEKILERGFMKIIPVSYRPYGRLYAY
jgi:glutamate synthase domain-containing protein 3